MARALFLTLVIHTIRTGEVPFLEITAARPVLLLTALSSDGLRSEAKRTGTGDIVVRVSIEPEVKRVGWQRTVA